RVELVDPRAGDGRAGGVGDGPFDGAPRGLAVDAANRLTQAVEVRAAGDHLHVVVLGHRAGLGDEAGAPEEREAADGQAVFERLPEASPGEAGLTAVVARPGDLPGRLGVAELVGDQLVLAEVEEA